MTQGAPTLPCDPEKTHFAALKACGVCKAKVAAPSLKIAAPSRRMHS